MVQAQGNNMKINIKTIIKIQIATVVFLFTFLLSSCDTNNANENDSSKTNTKNPPITTNETANEIQSKKVLNDAIKALNSVDDEFKWRDTHLALKESQKALANGEFELSIEIAQKVILKAKLMNEQQEFADNHWQDLIP